MSQSTSTPVGRTAQYTPDTENTRHHLETTTTLNYMLLLFVVETMLEARELRRCMKE